MERCLIHFLLVFFACNPPKTSLALECGIILGDTSKEINQVITTCLLPTIPVVENKVDNTTKPANFTDEDALEEPAFYGPRRGINQRHRRQEPTTNASSNLLTTTTTTPEDLYNTKEDNDPKRCAVRCIFKELKMLDRKMMPDHAKVSEGLLRFIENRQFRDFIQDCIDDCFGQVLDLVDTDSCGFSAKLVTCLAEKGRYNCADWPVGELPFPHKF